MTPTEIDRLAKIIWNYHLVHHTLEKADAIFVLGSNDLRVGEYAAELFHKDLAPYIIFSGGFGRGSLGVFAKPEAELLADVAMQHGVPREKIIIENKASNTGENVSFTRKLLAERNLSPHKFILVQKPFMERRTLATFKKVWPEKDFIVTSPNISFEEYPNEAIPKDQLIHIMLGDLQRIKLYPDKGFQVYQEIPAEVWHAFEQLAEAGYTDHLLKE